MAQIRDPPSTEMALD